MIKQKEMQDWLQELANCEKILPDEEVNLLGRISNEVERAVENVTSDDEVDEDLEAECQRLNSILGLPADTYSLTRIKPNLPECMKYGVRSGFTHINMHKFSPFSRGLQGAAIAITAYMTTGLLKARCWNELVIDQIIEDGDTYYCKSYQHLGSQNRKILTVLDLRKSLMIQKTHQAHVIIDDAIYTGRYRSQNPTEMNIIKALELFFQTYNAGVLTSHTLNASIWKDNKYFYMFDAQPRKENLLPDESRGTAKLILLSDLYGVFFVILDKSNIKNDDFVLYPIKIGAIIQAVDDDLDVLEKSVGEAERRPSGYDIQGPRALVKGSFHLNHWKLPELFRGRTHLIVALSALIYSRLIRANKWSTPIVDLIFNQAHIYLVDLSRVIGKKIDENFQLTLDDILSDIYLGIYAAKIKIESNIIPGAVKKGKGKGKSSIDSGLVDFFKEHQAGILEVKNAFYALWKDGDKYYFFDPFACDEEGFRVNLDDPEDADQAKRYKNATACVTMNATIDEVIETILENTGNTEKDPFFIHGVRVLYIKIVSENLKDKIVYRERKLNQKPVSLGLSPGKIIDQRNIETDTIPRPRSNAERMKDCGNQFPDMMKDINDFMMKEEIREEYVKDVNAKKILNHEEENDKLEKITFYQVVHSNCLILQASKNCLFAEYDYLSRGRQGISMAISAMTFAKLKQPSLWSSSDLNAILDSGNQLHSSLVDWIRKGSPKEEEEEEEEEDEEEEEEEAGNENIEDNEIDDESEDDNDDNEETDEEETETEEEEEQKNKAYVRKIPSFIDISMLPEKVKIGENWINFKYKKSLMQGDADPMVNLGEALERYFNQYNELILENNKLMYGIWKNNGYYFLFQPYGSDNEGWRVKEKPASLLVTDSINELVNILHGILEFNDRNFFFHFICIQSISQGKYVAPMEVETPEDVVEMYQTMFLPLTDEDLLTLKSIEQRNREELKLREKDNLDKLKEREKEKINEEDKNEEEEEEESEDENERNEDKKDKRKKEEIEEKEKQMTGKIQEIFVDPLIEILEQNRLNSPNRLNLFLLTTNVNLAEEIINAEAKEASEYERLKYNLPPPYVSPPKKVLFMLLAAKKAFQSVSSLVSCFSIDSKLAIKTDFPSFKSFNASVINTESLHKEPVKIIKLPPRKYFFSRILPAGFTPLRAINEKYIYDDKIDKTKEREWEKNKIQKKLKGLHYFDDIMDDTFIEIKVYPKIIPLGPVIKTPTPQIKPKFCRERKKKLDKQHSDIQQNKVMKTLVGNIENIMMNLIFSEVKSHQQLENELPEETDNNSHNADELNQLEQSTSDNEQQKVENEELNSPNELIGFIQTEDEYGIITGNESLDDRNDIQECKFKACFFAAILCLLTKIQIDVNLFRRSLIDDIIIVSKHLYKNAGILKYRVKQWTYDLELFKVKFYIVVNEDVFLEPEKYEMDAISRTLVTYLKKHSSGILVFENASYAFWFANNGYYLFDPYSCDEKGNASENGSACFLQFYKIDDFIRKIQVYSGLNLNNPYSIYNLKIKKMKWLTEKKKQKTTKKQTIENISTSSFSSSNKKNDESIEELMKNNELKKSQQRNQSLIELSDWIKSEKKKFFEFDESLRGFAALKNFNASVLEVKIVENDITRPNLPTFMSSSPVTKKSKTLIELQRRKPFDRKFNEHSILAEPLDLCIMAWSCIHEPSRWGFRTIRGIAEACEDLAFDSLLAAEDSTVNNMIDGLLTEFDIANYRFQAVFAPLHYGTLYSTEGWNLTMSIKKLFDSTIYTGALISCGKTHIGLMKIKSNFYFWYAVPQTKNFRIVTSTDFEDFVKLIVLLIDEIDEIEFQMRIITISYARKLDPDCLDVKGLHEFSSLTSLPQIHRKDDLYDIEKIFYSALPQSEPIFILGTVGYQQYEEIKEPKLKRCYFAALLSVTVNRDIMQSPIPSMVDKIIQVAENLYRKFKEPKYHTQHILRNVPIMNRIFDFKDVTLPLMCFDDQHYQSSKKRKPEMCMKMIKELKKYFKKHNSGVLHFSNCSYGFWYSQSTNAYYYFNPYQNDDKGNITKGGAGFLGIFPSLCLMIKSIVSNLIQNVTGFFIHQIHVESVNVISSKEFQEDPMWIYLDYHWSINHASNNFSAYSKIKKRKKKAREDSCEQQHDVAENKTQTKKSWNYYTIEISNVIYSLWGTLGAYDNRFGSRKGKNQVAICVAVLAMQFLCHPSKWGPAILDSAVICGDCYYTESLKTAVKSHKHFNSYNLQPFFKVFPHVWKIDYGANKCGILYGEKGRQSLAALLKSTLTEHSNILLRCGNITLAILATGDGFYVADPCWTGPPLFSRNHGALYVLRCRNLNALIYAIIKIINTNQKVEFFITPVSFNFKQEKCAGIKTIQKCRNDRKDEKNERVEIKKILLNPVNTFSYPRVAYGSNTPVPGAIVVPNEDSYLKYRQSVALGIKNNLENPPVSHLESTTNVHNFKNMMLSTSWEKNIGLLKSYRQSLLLNSSSFQGNVRKSRFSQKTSLENLDKYSVIEFLKNCDGYPKTVDFLEDKCVEKFSKYSGKHAGMLEESISKPLDCLPPRKFISSLSKKEFKKKNKEMNQGTSFIKNKKPKKSVVSRHQSTVFDTFMDNMKFEDEPEELTMADVL